MLSGVKFKCELKPNYSKRHLLKPNTFRFFQSDCRRTVIISVTSKTHCSEVQKYEEGKMVIQFLICRTNIKEEDYGKRTKILHGCLFEGLPNRAISAKKSGMAVPC